MVKGKAEDMKQLVELNASIKAARELELRLLRKALPNVVVCDSVIDIPVYTPRQRIKIYGRGERFDRR